MKVWLNGELVEDVEAHVSPADHGLLVGDGIFETLRSYEGIPFALDEHLTRLFVGASALGLSPLPAAALAGAVREVLSANELRDARIRITMTSGAGPPGLARTGRQPTVIVTAGPLVPWPATATALLSLFRRDAQSPLAGVKTISLAESVVALEEARAGGADEAILLNHRGELCEATTANVFCVLGGRVQTPALSSGCLAGITREHVLELSREVGYDAVEARLTANVLREAEELFLTSSTREIQPLVAVDGQAVGSGEPGPVTLRLADAYKEMIAMALAAGA